MREEAGETVTVRLHLTNTSSVLSTPVTRRANKAQRERAPEDAGVWDLEEAATPVHKRLRLPSPWVPHSGGGAARSVAARSVADNVSGGIVIRFSCD